MEDAETLIRLRADEEIRGNPEEQLQQIITYRPRRQVVHIPIATVFDMQHNSNYTTFRPYHIVHIHRSRNYLLRYCIIIMVATYRCLYRSLEVCLQWLKQATPPLWRTRSILTHPSTLIVPCRTLPMKSLTFPPLRGRRIIKSEHAHTPTHTPTPHTHNYHVFPTGLSIIIRK